MKNVNVDAIELVDVHAILIEQTLGRAGDRIWVYQRESDGTPAGGFTITGGQETPGDVFKGTSGPVALLKVHGPGNIDSTTFSAGWAHQVETEDGDDPSEGLYVRDDDGTLIGDGSVEDMIAECLKNGDFPEEHDQLRREILEGWAESARDEDED